MYVPSSHAIAKSDETGQCMSLNVPILDLSKSRLLCEINPEPPAPELNRVSADADQLLSEIQGDRKIA